MLSDNQCRLLLAHRGLQNLLAEKLNFEDAYAVQIEYLTPSQLISEATEGIPLIVPAVDELQTRFLAKLRDRLCLTPIMAVVGDLSGHQTYRAMSAGATSVLNLELSQIRMDVVLHHLFQGCLADASGSVASHQESHPVRPMRPTLVRSPGQHDDRVGTAERSVDADPPAENSDLLVNLLCGPNTIAAIARRFYCSERSMYRRVRRLYDTLGVSSRSELRIAIAEAS